MNRTGARGAAVLCVLCSVPPVAAQPLATASTPPGASFTVQTHVVPAHDAAADVSRPVIWYGISQVARDRAPVMVLTVSVPAGARYRALVEWSSCGRPVAIHLGPSPLVENERGALPRRVRFGHQTNSAAGGSAAIAMRREDDVRQPAVAARRRHARPP
jgi:hypothetical protein